MKYLLAVVLVLIAGSMVGLHFILPNEGPTGNTVLNKGYGKATKLDLTVDQLKELGVQVIEAEEDTNPELTPGAKSESMTTFNVQGKSSTVNDLGTRVIIFRKKDQAEAHYNKFKKNIEIIGASNKNPGIGTESVFVETVATGTDIKTYHLIFYEDKFFGYVTINYANANDEELSKKIGQKMLDLWEEE